MWDCNEKLSKNSEEMSRLKRNIDVLTAVVADHKKEIQKLQENFAIELKAKDQQMEGYKTIAANYQAIKNEHTALKDKYAKLMDLNANEQQRANKLQELLSVSQKERKELSDMADDIIRGLATCDLRPKGRHDLEAKIYNLVNKLKGEIYQQENLVSQLQNDLAAGKDLVKKLECNVAQLKNAISDRESTIAVTVKQNQFLQKDNEQLMKKQASLAKDFNFCESELQSARGDYQKVKQENKKLNDVIDITTKEHAKLRNIFDNLLADFKAKNYEQFRRDLDNKLACFDKLIREQESELNELKSQQDFEYKKINKDLEAIIRDENLETRAIDSLKNLMKNYQTNLLPNFRGGSTSTKCSKAPNRSEFNRYYNMHRV